MAAALSVLTDAPVGLGAMASIMMYIHLMRDTAGGGGDVCRAARKSGDAQGRWVIKRRVYGELSRRQDELRSSIASAEYGLFAGGQGPWGGGGRGQKQPNIDVYPTYGSMVNWI